MVDRFYLAAVVLFAAVIPVPLPALAQDIRGIEICTVEKQIDRRTSCLQSNVEFLQVTLTKATREAGERQATASRELAAQKAEIASLKNELAKIRAELAELNKAKK